MTTSDIPRRHWRSYANDPLPSSQEALAEPLRAFPSWFLRIECERCGKVRMLNEGCLSVWRLGKCAVPLWRFSLWAWL